MLPRFEYGQLYKFAVSVGLLLMAVAALLPWLVLRESGALSIPERQIQLLTPRAKRVVIHKQRDYEWFVDHYPYISSGLLVAGVLSVGYGVSRWKRRQDVADDLEDLQRDTARAQLRDLSPAEIEEKLDRETAEAMESEVTEGQEPNSLPIEVPVVVPAHQDWRETISEVEDEVKTALDTAFSTTHLIRSNVRIERANQWLDVDIVLHSSSRDPSYVVDVKYVRQPLSVVHRVRDSLAVVAAAAKTYENSVNSRVRGLLIVVLDKDDASSLDRGRQSAARWLGVAGPAFSVPVGVLVVSRRELVAISPMQLRDRIDSLPWRGSSL